MTKHDYLRRLEPEHYCGEAWVHWSLTTEHRSTGWLTPKFLYRFREILTHTCFRYRVACFIYCLMPDHAHLLWHGLSIRTNQLIAMEFFRKRSNESLRRIGFEWQQQGHDRVLREKELQETNLEGIGEYIARNPERKKLVPVDHFADYKYTGCLLPGYPELRLFQPDSWTRV
ncbi:hypothetical protein NHH03_14575 [Stieleria sp. TO1_6]|uniref:hypothetical protein n=1 Tax=Stieleria tagensis TaxID=2956795 RepID=UPI00209B3BF4|nr:hypothetical protein [Stieleria tagensis]MCO8122970.1 hypothetical protein [Stieleria tagensis]